MKKFLLLLSVCILSMIVSQAFAATNLRIAHQSNDREATARGFQKFREVIEAANVGIKVTIFPASQLVGSDRDAIEALKLEEIDMTSVVGLQFAPHVDAFYVFNADYLFDNLPAAKKKLLGPAGDALKKAALDKDINCRVATYFGGSGRIFWNNVRPIRTIADFKGIKARTAENPINVAELTALGVIPSPMAWNELYTALQQGTIEGLISSKLPILQQGLIDILKYATDTNHSYSTNIILVSDRFYKSLSDAQRVAFDKAVDEATDFEWDIAIEEESNVDDELMELMKEGRFTYTRLDDAERKNFRKTFVDATESLVAEKCGAELLELFR